MKLSYGLEVFCELTEDLKIKYINPLKNKMVLEPTKITKVGDVIALHLPSDDIRTWNRAYEFMLNSRGVYEFCYYRYEHEREEDIDTSREGT